MVGVEWHCIPCFARELALLLAVKPLPPDPQYRAEHVALRYVVEVFNAYVKGWHVARSITRLPLHMHTLALQVVYQLATANVRRFPIRPLMVAEYSPPSAFVEEVTESADE